MSGVREVSLVLTYRLPSLTSLGLTLFAHIQCFSHTYTHTYIYISTCREAELIGMQRAVHCSVSQ